MFLLVLRQYLVFHSLLTSLFLCLPISLGFVKEIIRIVVGYIVDHHYLTFSLQSSDVNQVWLEQYTDVSYNNHQSNPPGRLIHLLKCIAFKQICTKFFLQCYRLIILTKTSPFVSVLILHTTLSPSSVVCSFMAYSIYNNMIKINGLVVNNGYLF